MRSSRWVRLITSVWALWFAAVLVEPAPLTACLMRAAMGAHVTRDASAMPGMPGMPGDAGTHNGRPVDPSCMHLGACCCAPVLTMPLQTPGIVPAPIRVVRAQITAALVSAPVSAPAYAHPFAIGPPVAPG